MAVKRPPTVPLSRTDMNPEGRRDLLWVWDEISNWESITRWIVGLVYISYTAGLD